MLRTGEFRGGVLGRAGRESWGSRPTFFHHSPTSRGGVAVSTTFAPTMALNSDPMREATARAAAKAGMTVEAWIAHTDEIEARENNRRFTEHVMRQTPRYRDEEAA